MTPEPGDTSPAARAFGVITRAAADAAKDAGDDSCLYALASVLINRLKLGSRERAPALFRQMRKALDQPGWLILRGGRDAGRDRRLGRGA